VALLADVKIASLEEPSNGVWLSVQCVQKGHTLEENHLDEVLMDISINDEVQWSTLHPHI
jgi:hypothetical protein